MWPFVSIKGLSECSVYSVFWITLTKKASWKQLLNEELEQWFVLNVYVNVLDFKIKLLLDKYHCR